MRKERSQIKLLLWIGVGLLAGFLLNFIFAAKILPSEVTVSLDCDREPVQDSVYVTREVSKQWDEANYYIGAEYDFVVHNDTDLVIRDWSLDIPLSQVILPLSEEDYWNVDCVQEGEILHISSLDYTSETQPGYTRTFGMILKSRELMPLNPVTLRYRKVYDPFRLPSFPLLIMAGFVWCMILVKCLSEYNAKSKAKTRAEQDRQIILQSMSTFVNFIDAKDPYTKGHSQRVATVSSELAARLGLSKEIVYHVYYAGLLHDSGKISIPDNILKKVGILTPEEYAIMKTHSTHGGEILKDFTSVPGIREGALYHHERFDGKGYPLGLKGKDIPLFGRIICVADSYDAMARDRCYRKHLSKEKMLSEFQNNSGTQFDPEIVSIMIEMIETGDAEILTTDM